MSTLLRFILMVTLMTGNAWADTLTPETFVRLNSEARQLTLDGMEIRIGLLQNGATQEEQMAAAEQTQQSVEALFMSYGTTGSAHAAFGTYHQAAIEAWLEANPIWKQKETELNERFQTLSDQINGLLGVQ
ncbi:MAG: hypothetical protein ACU85E_10010 [Gammaproteobacteria bacterium]